MRAVYNPCRIYCLNDEAGLIICAWPPGVRKPVIPVPYSQETMNGFEYAAAIHMIMNGLVEEGMAAVTAIRARYDGERRNPWNEFECGSNYARSMASYALLNAFAGFTFDMVRKHIGFRPLRLPDGGFRCFWSLDGAWGAYEQSPGLYTVRVLHGELTLHTLGLPPGEDTAIRSAQCAGRSLTFTEENGILAFAEAVSLRAGESLTCHNKLQA
jgi:hypothetical protein